MTEHAHSTYVEGCYRCALSRDEVAPPGEDEAVDAYMAPKVQPVSALRIVVRHPDGTETDVTEGVQILYDHTVESMDWGSGFLDNDEALAVVKVAQACGFLTPDSAKETFMAYLVVNHAEGLRCQVCGMDVRYEYRWSDNPAERGGYRWFHTGGDTEEWHPGAARPSVRWRELPADHAVDLWPRGEVVDAETAS